MKRLCTLLLLSTISFSSVFAQNGTGTGFTGNGYYRVCNFGSKRYIYVTDNKDYSNKARQDWDFQAIQLWTDISRAISDPASVIYIKEVSSGSFDLVAQNSGVHDLTGYYVGVQRQRNGAYEVSATESGQTIYLSENNPRLDEEQGAIGVNASGNFRQWIVDKMETNHATNYFGITPTIELNGIYYHPFYAAFPFRPVSSDMNIYYIDRIETNNLFVKKIEGDVPANTPVIIECVSKDPSQNRLELLPPSSAKVTDNKLSGQYFCNTYRPSTSVDACKTFDPQTMRILDTVDGKLVMTNSPSDALLNSTTKWVIDYEIGDYVEKTFYFLKANTSYLSTDAQAPAVFNVCFDGMGINDVRRNNSQEAECVYSINGQQLRPTSDTQGLPAGLYIVKGKKVVVGK